MYALKKAEWEKAWEVGHILGRCSGGGSTKFSRSACSKIKWVVVWFEFCHQVAALLRFIGI